jgi:hypothetical protein
MKRQAWSRLLLIAGAAAMLAGAIDPLEGCVVVLSGSALLAFAALVGDGRYRGLLYASFLLVALGAAALLGHTMLGGFGGESGRSDWWWLSILPYPAGWLLGLTGAILAFRRGGAVGVR